MKLNAIIRHVRDSLGISQSEFASMVGVDRTAVIRWEGGKSLPNKIAQTNIYKIVKESGADLFSDIMKDLPEHKEKDGRIVLYHGSRSGIEGEIRPLSREHCDFGKGFYMGTQAQQPLTLIPNSEKPVLYTVELDLKGLNVFRVSKGIDWAMLVAYSRGLMEQCAGSALYERNRKLLDGYDVAVGNIADDRMFYVLDRFFGRNLTDKALTESLSALKLGEQYVALTEKACGQIRTIEKREISELERLCFLDESRKNRALGMRTADDICTRYRREGRFFDEMLKDGE